MEEIEKDVPIKEQNDGSVLAKVDFPEEIEDDEEKKTKKDKKAEKEEEHDDEEHEDHAEEDAEGKRSLYPREELRSAACQGQEI